MKNINIVLLFCLLLTSCSPFIERVQFVEYTQKYPNRFVITINTRDKFFEGRESFLSFKRDNYSFYSRNRSCEYNEKDIIMIALNHNTAKYDSLYLKRAIFNVTKLNDNKVQVEVFINDSLVPKMVNGIYNLTLVDSDSTGYRMFEYEK